MYGQGIRSYAKSIQLTVIRTIFPKARAELLRLLFADPGRAHHLRDLARLSGLAIGTIQREVANLKKAGLIREQRDGNRVYFSANRDHPIFPELQGIALKTTGLVPLLGKALQGLAGIRLAFVYGSFAEGTPSAESDIDVFLVGDAGLRELAPRLRIVADTMQREINPSSVSEQSFREKLRRGDAYISSVTSGNKLWIIGSEDELAAMA